MHKWLGSVIGALLAACAPPSDGVGAGESTQAADDGPSSVEGTTSGGSVDGSTTEGSTATEGGTFSICDGDGTDFDHEDDGGNGEGEGSGGGEDGTDGMADDLPIGALVTEVRMGLFVAGTKVEITDFVVSTPAVSLPAGDGWLLYGQMAAGGPHSGIPVAVAYDDPIVDTFVPGTSLRIIADVVTHGDRFWLWVHPIEGGELVYDADVLPPEPAVFTTDDLVAGEIADSYDSVLVRIEEVEVEDPDICEGQFAVDDGVKIDDLFLGDLAPTPAPGASFSAVIGTLLDASGGVEVAPRTPDDLVP